MKNIKEVFAEVAKNVKIDKALLQRIHTFERNFVNRNDEHINFFGGNLLGVDKPKFKPADWSKFFDEIVQIDDVDLRIKLMALPSVVSDAVVINDAMNNTCMWLVHSIFNSNLSAADKHQGMVDTLLIYHYKIITSKIDHDFQYYANREVAMATYAALSKKFSLKQHGNWGAVLRARAEDIISPRSIHLNTIKTFGPDKRVHYLISDTQGRVKELVKSQWNVINAVKANDARIVNQSNVVMVEGEEFIRDTVNGLIKYREYIHSVVGNPRDFIKSEVTELIAGALITMSPTHLDQALRKLSELYWKDHDNTIHTLINETMIHAFDVLNREAKTSIQGVNPKASEPMYILFKIRGVYMSSRSTDATLLKLRDMADKFVEKNVSTKNASALAAVRTGLLMYIVARAFAMKYYSA